MSKILQTFVLMALLAALGNMHLSQKRELADIAWEREGVRLEQEAQATQLSELTSYIARRNPKLPFDVAEEHARAFQLASRLYSLDAWLLVRVSKIESATRHYLDVGVIESHMQAKGIMQVMDFWAARCPHSKRVEDLRHPTVNLLCGAFVLAHYRDAYNGNMEYALTAYNSGHRGVRALIRGRDYTDGYARKVLNATISI